MFLFYLFIVFIKNDSEIILSHHVVVLRRFPKPVGFVIPFQVDDFKRFCESSVIIFQFCDVNLYHVSVNSSHRGAQSHRVFLISILVLSTEESMPWHGNLRAETGDLSTGEQGDRSFIDRGTVEQELIVKGGLPALWA